MSLYFFVLGHSPAKFEEAIAATGFGKYNYFLLMAVAVPCINQLLCTVELSYVTPVAQCDLNLTLEDRGALNAITFAGKYKPIINYYI